MKSNKKAQIMTFMIIGVVILVISMVFLYLNEKYAEETMPQEAEVQERQLDYSSVQSFVSGCVSKVAEESVYYVSYQGGYELAPGLSRNVANFSIPYYLSVNETHMPEIGSISNEFERYIEKNLPLCTGDFSNFKQQGYDVKTGEVDATANIYEKSIVFDVKYPIEITKDDARSSIEDFRSTFNVNYNYVYDTVQKIVNAQKENSSTVPIGFISELSHYENFTFETIDFEDDTVLFSFMFPQSNDSRDTIVFNYLNKYDWKDLRIAKDQVSMEPIPAFNILSPTNIKYQVKALGENIVFSDNTELFDINPQTGLINFNTMGLENGNYTFLIKAEDPEGDYDMQFMDLNIGVPKKPPVIEPISEQTAYVNYEFYYKVEAEDPSNSYLVFRDHTTLFDINEFTGEIRFTPEQPGFYNIKIEVANEQDHAFEYMKLTVE